MEARIMTPSRLRTIAAISLAYVVVSFSMPLPASSVFVTLAALVVGIWSAVAAAAASRGARTENRERRTVRTVILIASGATIVVIGGLFALAAYTFSNF